MRIKGTRAHSCELKLKGKRSVHRLKNEIDTYVKTEAEVRFRCKGTRMQSEMVRMLKMGSQDDGYWV